MPKCQAEFCSVRKGEGVSTFKIPDPVKNYDLCAQWLRNLHNPKLDIRTFLSSRSKIVCEKHFEKTCFKDNIRAKLLGYAPKKKFLKENAVPTIFPTSKPAKKKPLFVKEAGKKITDKSTDIKNKPKAENIEEMPAEGDEVPPVDKASPDIPEAENPLQCRYCGKILTRVFYRKEHERIHTGERPFACSFCDKRFNSQSSCKKHERIHSKKKKTFECEHCGRRFYDFLRYRSHLRAHAGDKPYSCHICDRSFALETVLKKHLIFHDEQKQYRCSLCSKIFASSFELKEHQRSHSGQSLHKCRYCNLRFGTENRRNIHEKYHERSDVHECKECGASFESANSLATHEAKSEMAGGCHLIREQENNIPSTSNGSYTSSNDDQVNNIEIGNIGQVIKVENCETSDITVLNGQETEMDKVIYPTGYQRLTESGIKQEQVDQFENVVEQNGIDTIENVSNISNFGDDSQEYILSPCPSTTYNGFTDTASTEEKGSQTEQCDVDELYDALESSGKVHECKSCQILFRNYTMFLVHKTLHINPDRPFACHLCDHIAKDNVDFNAHLIWHMK